MCRTMESNNFDLHHKSILIVDDEADLREIVAGELEFMGSKVYQAENIQHALDLLSKNSIDLIISDIRMPGGSGIELLEIVKNKYGADFPFILITGFADITPMEAYGKGAEALISKPFQLDELFKIIMKNAKHKDERWSSEGIKTKKVIRPVNEKIIIGRGGASFFVDVSERIDPGEAVSFELELEGKRLSGTGICRWIKALRPGSAILGLEFFSLEDESWKEISSLKRSNAFIPTAAEL